MSESLSGVLSIVVTMDFALETTLQWKKNVIIWFSSVFFKV
jgi:hypothetical protein